MIIQCDFDGTIAIENVSVLIREKFAIGNWRQVESDYTSGLISVEESNKRQFSLVREPREKLVAFARQNTTVKAGFLELVDYCRTADIDFAIVSSGLDFYIEAVLDNIGAPHLELHCARTSFGQDGVTVSYIGPDGNTVGKGFKQQYLSWLKQRAGRVIYIGDGLSDLEPARSADQVFATGTLHKLLDSHSVSHHTFADFHDVLRQIRSFS